MRKRADSSAGTYVKTNFQKGVRKYSKEGDLDLMKIARMRKYCMALKYLWVIPFILFDRLFQWEHRLKKKKPSVNSLVGLGTVVFSFLSALKSNEGFGGQEKKWNWSLLGISCEMCWVLVLLNNTLTSVCLWEVKKSCRLSLKPFQIEVLLIRHYSVSHLYRGNLMPNILKPHNKGLSVQRTSIVRICFMLWWHRWYRVGS